MAPASPNPTRPRPEPEVVAANVRAMLAPFFNGRGAGPTPVMADTKPVNPWPSRESVAEAVEALIDLMDAIDGDADFEVQCEDEGAASEDEGAQCDDEGAVEYEATYNYGVDQRVSLPEYA